VPRPALGKLLCLADEICCVVWAAGSFVGGDLRIGGHNLEAR